MYNKIKNLQELARIYNKDKEELNKPEEFNQIEENLYEQALNYKSEENIGFDDIMEPSFGTETIIEVANRGGLRHINIDFDDFGIIQSEYSEIKNAIDNLIKGESDESVDDAIDQITKYKDKALKVVFSFAKKFNFEDDVQCDDLRILMKKLCLTSLKGRDTIIAVLIGANSKPHIKLAMLAAGEVREDNATKYICDKLKDKDLFEIAFDALIDIRDIKAVKPMLDVISTTERGHESRIIYLMKRAPYFVDFGNSIIKDIVECYNNANPWVKPILTKILIEYQEDIIPDTIKTIEKETDDKKLDSLYMLLGKLNSDKAAEILVKSYKSGKNIKSSIIGLGQIKTKNVKKLFKDILIEGNEEPFILQEVIISLPFMVSINEAEEIKDLIRPYCYDANDRVKIYSNAALARLEDENGLDMYIENLASMNFYIRNCATNLINRLKPKQITKILEKCITLPQNKVNLILMALTRRKIFNKEIGKLLKELLETSSYFTKIEIYKIIGKTINTNNEVLPIDILYNALDTTTNNSEKMVLQDIISNIKGQRGKLGKR